MNKRRNAHKLIGLILVLLLTVCALPGAAQPTSDPTTEEDAPKTELPVDETVEQIAGRIEEIRTAVDRLETELGAQKTSVTGVWQYKKLLDEQISLLAEEIDCLSRLAAHYDVLIQTTEGEIEALRSTCEVELQALTARLRQSYEEGMPGLLQYFSRSDSLLSLLIGLERRDQIEEYDRALMEDLNVKHKEIADKNQALTTLRADRYLIEAKQAARTQYLNTKLQEGGGFLLSLTADVDRFSYYIQLSQAGMQTADRQILQETAAVWEQLGAEGLLAEIAAKQAQSDGVIRSMMEQGSLQKGKEYYEDGAVYLWPLVLSEGQKIEISALMGYRSYQVGGKVVGDYHSGLDLAAVQGTDVVAAASGKVVDTGYAEGYGHYVAILHADGSVTRYAHLSEIIAVKGDCVLQGESIGKAGCSGNSNGVGCHFELWIDGVRVDAQAYLTLLSASLSDAAE